MYAQMSLPLSSQMESHWCNVCCVPNNSYSSYIIASQLWCGEVQHSLMVGCNFTHSVCLLAATPQSWERWSPSNWQTLVLAVPRDWGTMNGKPIRCRSASQPSWAFTDAWIVYSGHEPITQGAVKLLRTCQTRLIHLRMRSICQLCLMRHIGR